MLKKHKEIIDKETIDKELAFYRKEKLLEINTEIVEIINVKRKEIQELTIECAKQTGEYEHEFHAAMEEKRIELAKLDSEIDAKKQLQEKESACLNKEIDNLREMIDDKNETIVMLLNKLPVIKEINYNK